MTDQRLVIRLLLRMHRIRYIMYLKIIVIVGLLYVGVQTMLVTNNAMKLNSGKLMNSDTQNDTSEQVVALVPPQINVIKNTTEKLLNSNDTSEQLLSLVPHYLHKYLIVNFNGNSTERHGPKNITDMRKAIQKINEKQTIYNEDIFGPVRNDTIIIAIQTFYSSKTRNYKAYWSSEIECVAFSSENLTDFTDRMSEMNAIMEGTGIGMAFILVSLAQAKDIVETLLIFSHDHYDEDINDLVKSIDFTRVMQIFYPYSIQTHPTEFPGTDPNDCPRDAKLVEAIKLKCNNALHPDLHEHYREAKYTQTKHHWWWKANRIFNQLRITTGHTGLVVFLEDDHYVAKDFIHIIHFLQATRDKMCPHCEILCAGARLKTFEQHFGAVHVEITDWEHNMGFAFNKTVWENIVELQEQFCDYDDYNWDYSLFHLSQNRPGGQKFKVILSKEPRVFHIGECGFHYKKSNCDVSSIINTVHKFIRKTKSHMGTAVADVTVIFGAYNTTRNICGGWADLRDRELCLNMTTVGRKM